MKIRHGFVSNSSSSSFIIPLKDTPSSVEDLRQMMFGDVSHIEYMYNWSGDNLSLDTYTLAEIVYKDVIEATTLPTEELLKIAEDDWYGDEVCDVIENLIEKYPNRKVISITYGDNDGKYFTQLEHSGIIESTFEGSVRISQH